jgi:error-prone DNA polymerase
MNGYVELHAHSCWSLREGASRTGELIGRALELGYQALALTDHDNLYGAMEFAKDARERGLKPITGTEITMIDDSHLTVLCESLDGYRNLCRLLSMAYREGGKDSPAIEQDWLFEHREGLIVLSGCRNGALSRLLDCWLQDGDVAAKREAEHLVATYRDALGSSHYFVELQHHDVYGDTPRVAALAALAGRLGLEVVATNNVHYHVRGRHRLNDVLVSIRHHKTLDASHIERRPNSEFFLKRPETMARHFRAYPQAVANTVAIAERCTFDLSCQVPYELPNPVSGGQTADSQLRSICEEAFSRRYGPLDAFRDEARDRLELELRLIAKHRLAGFFLIYRNLLELANEVAQEVRGRDPRLAPDEHPVARGRGSSVSSITCYLIGLSHIDPIQNKLGIDRFLNEELQSLPDIDLDFPRDVRDVLLQRVYDSYGKEHAALIASFPSYRLRSAVADIGKTLELPAPTLAKLSKLADGYSDASGVEREVRRMPELRDALSVPAWRQLIELAGQVAGFPRHVGQHVGGVVVSADPISSVVPVEPARMEGRWICQWDKDSVDDARMIKIDFLSLGMLSAVQECLDIVEETEGKRPDLGTIPHDETEIYDSISAGDTMGLFQVESRAQIQTLPRTQPRTIEDLAVQVAIVRPGPILAGAMHPYMEFRRQARNKRGPEIDYGHPELKPLLEPFLRETVGHVLFQDQVLQVAQAVAGFSPGKADQLRRAMSRKRSAEAMDDIGPGFFAGAAAKGVSRAAAEVAWNKMHGFSAFGFPKSHALAFGLLAYESAWLRYHHPAAYYCALYNNQPMGFYSVEVLNGDAERHGILILPPDINCSRAAAWPENGNIRLGLQQVKGLGGGWFDRRGKGPEYRSLPERIVDERQANGDYRSLYDLVTRTCLSREQAETLITAGALEAFGLPRRELLWQLALLFLPEVKRRAAQRAYQPSLPLSVDHDMVLLPALSPWQEVAWDFDRMGYSPGRHPMALVRPLLHEGIITNYHLGGINNPNRLHQGMEVELAGMVVTRQRPVTAKGTIFMLLEDEFGLANIIVHKDLADSQRTFVRATPFVIVRGRIDNLKSGLPNIVAKGFRHCPLPGLIAEPASHNFG